MRDSHLALTACAFRASGCKRLATGCSAKIGVVNRPKWLATAGRQTLITRFVIGKWIGSFEFARIGCM